MSRFYWSSKFCLFLSFPIPLVCPKNPSVLVTLTAAGSARLVLADSIEAGSEFRQLWLLCISRSDIHGRNGDCKRKSPCHSRDGFPSRHCNSTTGPCMAVGLELQGPSELIPKAAVFFLILLNLKMALQVAVPFLVDPSKVLPWLVRAEVDSRQSLMVPLQ